MPVGTNPKAARMLVEYWSGSAWTSVVDSGGVARILSLEINDNLNAPRYTILTLFNPRASGQDTFGTGDFDTTLKEKMKIRVTDQATKSILFLGAIESVVPENSLKGYTLTVTAYDGLVELQNNVLKKDTLNDASRGDKPAIGKNDFISEDIGVLIDFGSYNQGTGDRSLEIVNTTDSDDTGAYRFQASLGKMTTREKDFSESGGSFLNAIKRLGELEAGIESTASGAITGGLKPYNFYADTNFKTTATNTEGSGNFFNYFPAGCMPAAAQSGTSYTVANPADDGLTLMFGTGASVTETGQTLKMLPTFSFEDLARERITHLNAHFVNPVSGYAEDIEFEVFNYKAISSGAAIQDLYEPSGTGTGGTETSKTISQDAGGVFDASSGGNNIGFLQYLSNTGGAGFALLSGTTGDNGSIRHAVAAGEQLHIRNSSGTTVGTITLSDTTSANGSDIFRPQQVFKQKSLKNFSIKTGDLLSIRRAIAAAFANKDTRRVRASFSMASGYPYHFVEGEVDSVSTNTITDSTIVNQHSTSTDGFSAANIDSFPTAGIRTGMVLHKLTGQGGTRSEHGYISKTEDNSLTAVLTNSATFSSSDFYRVYVPLRAGHAVQIKNTAIDSSPFTHVITSIQYTEGERGFMTNIETVGDISNAKATTAGPRVNPSTPPIIYDDETYAEGVPLAIQKPTFTGTVEPGRQADSSHKNTSIKFSSGTLNLNGKEYSISAGDSEDATTGINGEFADDTDYIISFNPAVSETKFIIQTDTDFKNQAVTAAGGSGNSASAFQGDVVRIGTAKKSSNDDGESSFQLTHAELPGSNFKFDKDSISAKTITANEIKANSITAAEIAANTITASQIEAGTITATELASGAVTVGGSSATSGARFVVTHPNANPSGAGTDFFRAYDGSNSSSNASGFWFNLDSHNQSLQIADGAASPTVIVEIDKGGIDIKDGSESTSFLNFFKSSTNIMKMFAASTTHNSSTVNFQMFFPTNNAVLQVGSGGAFVLQPHVSNTDTSLGTASKGWNKFYTANIYSTETNLQINAPLNLTGADGTARSLITSAGNLTIDAQGSNDDIIFKGTSGASDVTMLTLDASTGGNATFNKSIYLGDVDTATADAYGIFRFTADPAGGSNDVLAFNAGQTNATPASTTNDSAFWTMWTQAPDSNTSRLHFEPIDDFSTADGHAHNFAYIGYNNPLVAVNSFYHYSGGGSASNPTHSFYGDSDTGMYNISADRLGFATGGTQRTTIDSSGTTLNTISSGTEAFNIFVTSAGLIKFVSSSERYKKDIVSLTTPSEKIYDLEPVNFTWKETGEKDFGLIAEKVHELIPELAVLKDGRPESVKYSMLSVLLLNEVQKLKKEIEELKENK